jgi:hypothetical protein
MTGMTPQSVLPAASGAGVVRNNESGIVKRPFSRGNSHDAGRRGLDRLRRIAVLETGAGFLAEALSYARLGNSPNYWTPTTLFGWVPGLESFLFAFNTGGLAATLYKVIGRRALKAELGLRDPAFTSVVLLLSVVPILLGWAFPLSLFAVRLSSIEAVAMGLGGGLIACKRPDLIGEILAGGGLLVAFHFGALLVLDRLLAPGWIARTWNFHTLSGVQIIRSASRGPLVGLHYRCGVGASV